MYAKNPDFHAKYDIISSILTIKYYILLSNLLLENSPKNVQKYEPV